MIGSVLQDIEVVNTDHDVCSLPSLLVGAEATVLIFSPWSFGHMHNSGSLEALLVEMNEALQMFNDRDIRVACITREPPATNRHWLSERDFKFDVLSDPTLVACEALVGTMDLANYLKAKKNVQIQSYIVPKAGVVVVGGDGTVLAKFISENPDNFSIKTLDILKMTGN